MAAQTEIPFLDGMKVGLGYDVLTGVATKSPAVMGTSLTAPAQAGGQIVTKTLQIAQETSVLHQALGISGDVSAGSMFGDASAKFKFASDIAVNSFSLYVVVGVQVFNATQTLDNPVLSEEAADLLRKHKTARFRDRFGDRFILGIKTGGEYFAIYKVESLDTTERSSIAGEIHARAGAPGVAGGSLDAAISSKIAASKSKLDVSVHVFQAGGSNTGTETTLDAIMQKARVFPTLVGVDQGVPYSMLVHDYRGLALPGDELTFIDVQNQQDVLTFNASLLNGFSTVINNIDFVRKNIDHFKNADGSNVDDAVLAKARKDCLQQVDAIRLQMSKCSNDATTCMRVQSAPEDFARLLPKTGDSMGSTRVTVPNMVEQFPIATLGFSFRPPHDLVVPPFPLEPLTAKTVPFTGEPIALEGEFGNLAYVADLAADDIHPPFEFGGTVFVKAQDPPGGSVVSKGSTVKLTLRIS
ncbi:PASTA domain-containing protein [Streptomyces chryseus]